MALGVDTVADLQRKTRRRILAGGFSKKIAVQFTPDQFARINTFADGKAVSFAAAVRRLIFENEMLP